VRILATLGCLGVVYWASGCGPSLPKAEEPRQSALVLSAARAEAWGAVLTAVEAVEGTVLTNDKESGLLVYTIGTPATKDHIFVNVHILSRGGKTAVYAFPRSRFEADIGAAERAFFAELAKAAKG
jgi:hypothetical protein